MRASLCLAACVAVMMISTTARAQAQPPVLGGLAISGDIDRHLRSIRDRSLAIAAVAADIPAPTVRAAATLVDDEGAERGFGILLLRLGGWLAEALFKLWSRPGMRRIAESPLATVRQRIVAQGSRVLFAQCPVISFAVGACFAYLAVEPPASWRWTPSWPPSPCAARGVLGRFLFAPGGPQLRLLALFTDAA